MAQIKEYANTQNVNPGPEESTAYSLERYGRIEQESIQQAGSGLKQVANTIATHEAKLDASDTTAAYSKQDEQTYTAYADWKQNHPYDPQDPDASYNDFLETHVRQPNESLKGQTRTQTGVELADKLSAERIDRWTRTITTDRINEEQQRVVDNTNSFVTSNANVATLHPEQAADLIKQTEFYADAMLPSNLKKDFMGQAGAHIADSALEGSYIIAAQNARHALLNNITNDPAVSALGLEVAQDTLNQARAHAASLQEHATPGKFAEIQQRFSELADRLPGEQHTLSNAAAEDKIRQQKIISDNALSEHQKTWTNPNLSYANEVHSILTDQRLTPEARDTATRMVDFIINQPKREVRAELSADRAEARAAAQANTGAYVEGHQQILSGLLSTDDEILDYVKTNNLAVPQLNGLMAYSKSVRADREKADGDLQATQAFYKHNYDTIANPNGIGTDDDKNNYNDAFLTVQTADAAARARGVPPDKRYDPKSPDYVGWAFDKIHENLNAPGAGLAKYQGLINQNAKALGTKPVPVAPTAFPRVTTDADYNALPKGTKFYSPDGKLRIKP